MAIGKSINKGFQMESQVDIPSRKGPHIEMPPLSIEQAVPSALDQIDSPHQVVEPVTYDQQMHQQMIDPQPEEIVEDEEEYEEEVAPVIKEPSQSFREIRSAKEKAERERDALMSKVLEMQTQHNNRSNTAVEEPDELDELDLDIAPEDLIEGKHLTQYAKHMKEMKKELRGYKAQAKEIALERKAYAEERKLYAEYPDFNSVLNNQSVNMLNEKYPAIAKSLGSIPDAYDKAVAAYEMIKNLNLHEAPMKKNASISNDKAKALVNAAKPRPLASVSPQQGDSPLSKANAFANGLTDELTQQLRKEMNTSRRAY